jgi:hypothetical protein
MDNTICDKFAKMGARAVVVTDPRDSVSLNVLHDDRGEYFELRHGRLIDLSVLDVRSNDRHLLLMTRDERAKKASKSKFLCGHDERHWFVAAVPEYANARDVQTAKDALKPSVVWDAMRRSGVRLADRDKRRTRAFVRQGEWFFIPVAKLKADEKLVLSNEPIRRGAGKPHMCEQLYRTGGEQVFVSRAYPNGLTSSEYRALPEAVRRQQPWTPMFRNARVYVRGRIRHPDHETVWLGGGWHEVVMNTETQAVAMRNVAFLD